MSTTSDMYSSLGTTTTTLTTQIGSFLQQSSESFSAEKERKLQKMSHLKKELESVRNQYQAAQNSESATSLDHQRELDAALAPLKQSLERLELQHKTAHENRSTLQSQVVAAKSEIEKRRVTQMTNIADSGVVDELQAVIQRLQGEYQRVTAMTKRARDLSYVEEELPVVEGRLKEEKAMLKALEDRRMGLQQRFEVLKAEEQRLLVATADAEYIQLENSELENTYKSLVTQSIAQAAQIEETWNMTRTVTAQRQLATSRRQELQSETAKVRKEHAEAMKVLEDERRRLDHITKEIPQEVLTELFALRQDLQGIIDSVEAAFLSQTEGA